MNKSHLVKLNVKNIVKSFLDENLTPRDIRLQAAKGLIPLETSELITSFYYFLFDRDEEVKSAAKESIQTLPESMLLNFLALDIPGEILDYFAKEKKEETFLEAIILNKKTPNRTFVALAETVSERLAHMIAENQERIIAEPAIISSIERNKNVHESLIEGLKTFMGRMKPAQAEEPAAAEEIILEEEGAPEKEPVAKFEEFFMQDMLEHGAPLEETEVAEGELADYEKPSVDFPPDEALDKYSEEEIEELKLSTYQRIQSMSIAEKIQEALKGSREARSMLIKDSNKLVCTAVVKSPKITEDEILKISGSRSVHEEVLRIICLRDDWLRNYRIKMNIVTNPKTPFKTAMKFMNFLLKKDLETIAKSKMVPNLVAATAKRLALTKK